MVESRVLLQRVEHKASARCGVVSQRTPSGLRDLSAAPYGAALPVSSPPALSSFCRCRLLSLSAFLPSVTSPCRPAWSARFLSGASAGSFAAGAKGKEKLLERGKEKGPWASLSFA